MTGSARCDPSYNLQAGLTPADPMVTPGAMADYVDAGFYVVVADYEGEQFDEAAGQQEGYATLDGIRAAESRLGLSAGSTPVALVGFSVAPLPPTTPLSWPPSTPPASTSWAPPKTAWPSTTPTTLST